MTDLTAAKALLKQIADRLRERHSVVDEADEQSLLPLIAQALRTARQAALEEAATEIINERSQHLSHSYTELVLSRLIARFTTLRQAARGPAGEGGKHE